MIELRPLEMLIGSLIILWLGMGAGSWLGDRNSEALQREDRIIKTLEGAVLTLFGLLLGFMFSMAVSRYELRRQLIVEEADAIGTTWLRTATLSEPGRTQQQQLLRQYVPVRVAFLAANTHMRELNASVQQTSALQDKIWQNASAYAVEHHDVLSTLYLTSLNQAIDLSESRTAAFENRIPLDAWLLLLFVGFVATLVVGLDVHSHNHILRSTLPFVIALTLTLTVDLDTPQFGLIRLSQPSMDRVAQLVQGPPPQDR